MAEVATKKSINVVSSKKNEVCGVQSNNGLIDLDDLTASNNQLISLCDDDDDDDLVLTNNTRNELDNEDKSLQELIESELALRICSSKSDDDIADELEEEPVVTQPEPIKRIVLDRRQEPVDINAEFIAAESEHYSLIEEPHQNGHVSPDANTEIVKPEPAHFYDQEEDQVFVEQSEVGQKTCDDDWKSSRDEPEEQQATARDQPGTDVPDFSNVANNFIDTSQLCAANEENELAQKPDDAANINTDYFDGALHQQNQGIDEQKFPSTNEESSYDVTLQKCNETSLQTSLISQDKQSLSEIIEEADCIASQSEIFTEMASTQEFLATERLVLSEEANQETVPLEDFTKHVEASLGMSFSEIEDANSKLSKEHDDELGSFQDDITSQSETLTETANACQRLPEITDSPAVLESESAPECSRDVAEDPQNQDESSSELSASDSTFIEKTEIVAVSDTNVTIFTETKRIAEENLDSWTTVEEATKSADVEEKRGGNVNEATSDDNEEKANDSFAPPTSPRAPLATPDETETSDVSNACDVSVLFFFRELTRCPRKKMLEERGREIEQDLRNLYICVNRIFALATNFSV